MKFKAFAIFTLLLFHCLFGKSQNNKEVVDFVEKFLISHNPLADSVDIRNLKGKYHLFHLQKVHHDGNDFNIYKFSWNYSHIATNYILIVDEKNKILTIYGLNNLNEDMVSLMRFFGNVTNVKESVMLKCYQFLIMNYYPHYGQFETIPLNPNQY